MGRISDVLRTIPGAVLDPGWETRGGTWPDPDRVVGVFVHHTAGALGKDAPSLPICRNGRTGPNPVPGPLCNLHIARSGVVTVLAGEKANHAGAGSSVVARELERAIATTGDAKKRGLVDDATISGRTIGIEVEHRGLSIEPWGAQVPALLDVLEHLCEGLHLAPNQVIGHREWTPRKVDPVYAGGIHDVGLPSMDWIREQLQRRLQPVGPVVDENLPILGTWRLVDVDQAVAYLDARRPPAGNGYTKADLATIVRAYATTASLAGIPLGVAIAQLAHETSFVTSEWSARPRRNPAGIGVTGQTAPGTQSQRPTVPVPAHHDWQWVRGRWELGVVFPRWAPDAADAHVGRLAAYAVPLGAETKEQARLIDIAQRWRVIPTAVRGSARTLAELGKARNPKGVGWAVPGTEYGAALARHIRAMRTQQP